jgi:hypothetical protein
VGSAAEGRAAVVAAALASVDPTRFSRRSATRSAHRGSRSEISPGSATGDGNASFLLLLLLLLLVWGAGLSWSLVSLLHCQPEIEGSSQTAVAGCSRNNRAFTMHS